MRYTFFGLLFLTLSAFAPAHADNSGAVENPDDILGVWSFKTSAYRGGQCIMSGKMHLTHAGEADVYDCEITAVEECTSLGRSVVLQSCTARRFGNQVSVRSIIDEMLESKQGLEGLPASYAPDNFSLTIKSSRRMFGSLVSAVSAPVEFTRELGGMS